MNIPYESERGLINLKFSECKVGPVSGKENELLIALLKITSQKKGLREEKLRRNEEERWRG